MIKTIRVPITAVVLSIVLIGTGASVCPSANGQPPDQPGDDQVIPKRAPDYRTIQSGTVVAVTADSISIQGFVGELRRSKTYWRTPDGGTEFVGDKMTYTHRGVVIPATRIVITAETMTLSHPDHADRIIRRTDEPIRRLRATPELLAGRPMIWRPEQSNPPPRYATHLLTDVRVGDRGSVFCRMIDGVDSCEAIAIRERPGGQVPPLRETPKR